jgi:hypothetical protein
LRSLRYSLPVALVVAVSAFTLAQTQPPAKQPILEIPQADASVRYRYVDNTAGEVISDDLQYRFSVRPRVNLRKTGTYVGARFETGSTFGSGWSNTGIGRSPSEWVLNAKTFYAGQHLGENAEVEVGAMDFEYGAISEAIYADNDAYNEGYRLRLHDLEGRYLPTKVVLHFGYVGDFNQVNSFARLHRLGEVNYIQVLAEKSLTKKVTASVQFNRLNGLNLILAGTKFNLPDRWWINEARIETVARLNNSATAGWAFTISKTKNRLGKLNPGLYYVHLPTGVYQVGSQQALINGDVYGLGKRLGGTSKYQVTKQFDVTALITRRLDTVPGFRWRAQLVVRYQFASMLKWLP